MVKYKKHIFEYITEVFKYSDKEREMFVKMKPHILITVFLLMIGFQIADVSAMKLTLSDRGLMLLDEYSTHMRGVKSSILEKRHIEGVGVEFDIYFPGNEDWNKRSIYYVFSEERLKEVFKGVDVAACDAFELKFTIIAVDGSTSEENTGILIVGAHMGGAFRPEAISLGGLHPNTAVSTTPMDTDKVSKAGFTTYMSTKEGWNPNGTAVTLLIEPASDDILVPLDDPNEIIESEKSIIYVDSNASGANNGTNWADAFRYLQDGLGCASEGDEIWVADGTYIPDQGENKKKGDKNLSFVLKKGVAIYGGFPLGGGRWEERNRSGNTILSGDLQGNDAAETELETILQDKTRSDNSYHVVSASGTNFDTILDGFVIIGGNAKGPSQSSFHKGGGLYFKSGSLTVSNCVFKLNCGSFGGAVCNRDGNPLMFNCNFSENLSKDMGGAVYSSQGSPLIYNCVFVLNHAKEKGGAVYNEYNSPIITNCTFFRNSAYAGGGIYCEKSIPIVNNCILWDNSSRYGKLEPSQIYAVEATVGYSCIQGLTESLQGNSNMGFDPKFLDGDNNNFELRYDSPCVDAGDNDLLPSDLNIDIDGTARLKDGNNDGTVQIDIGAQEF